jgi:DNA-binding NtrC family response regulator
MNNQIKLLVVDDEVRFLNTLTKRLSLRDFDVTTASSGQEALELAQFQDFDLVLLDLRMPGMSGEEVLRLFKEQHPLTEVVILTGHGSVESAVECKQAGSYMYLQKPAETTELLRMLKEAYQKRLQRKLALSEEKLLQLTDISLSESPLSILRKLKELDTSR